MKMNPKEIQSYLDKIKSDELFANSPRYYALLTFLVEKSINNEPLKETTIGIEFFNKNYEEVDKNSGSIRVYMYNLRKKLVAYYAANGKQDNVVFEMSKGSYNIKILRQKNNSKRVRWIVGIASVVLVALFSLGCVICCNKSLYCWKGMMNNKSQTTIVLADQITVRGVINNARVSMLHAEISNHAEYLEYIKNNNQDTLTLNAFSLYTKAIPYALSDLTRWFYQQDASFKIISESEFKYIETNKSNIVYIGQSKTMNTSKNIFLKDSKIFSVDGDVVTVKRDTQETRYRLKFIDSKTIIEYAMVSYFPLQDGNSALYFVSNNDIGTIATVKRFTNPESLKVFYDKLPSSDCYFNALFKVNGVERNEVDCELIELEVLDCM